MVLQIADVDIENGTSSRIAPDILAFAGAYISIYMPDTEGALSWRGLNSWACGLNGQTLAFSAADLIAKLPVPSTDVSIRENNQKAIALLEKWFMNEDDLSPALWEKFDKELEANKVTL